jgi:excisionase family DNA binding protein
MSKTAPAAEFLPARTALRLALRPEEAAEAIGVSLGTFNALVSEGRMPKPVVIPGRRIVRYDAAAVRNAWEALKEAAQPDDANEWDE